MGKSVVVGNRQYDAVTGLPLSSTDGNHVSHISRRTLRTSGRLNKTKKTTTPHMIQPAQTMHSKTQRSKTLNRAYIKKPTHSAPRMNDVVAPVKAATPSVAPVTKSAATAPTATHAITTHSARRIDSIRPAAKRSLTRVAAPKAAPQAPAKTPVVTSAPDAPAERHPIVQKVHAKQALRKHEVARAAKPLATPPASIIKQAVVNEALATAPKHHAKQLKLGFRKRTKILSAAFGCMALLLLGGYLTYLNAPNLSVRVAAAQAGINASYPSYHPDGYSLHGPVAFNSGEVSMTFVANANKEVSYLLEQSRSNWDSQALLDNYVRAQSGGDYNTSQVKGITIYTYNGNAAWVSGGILYTISGNASLSPDQIRRIATSLS